MTCSCPKCNDQTELDIIDIPAEGSSKKCSACGTSFIVRRESFACRALHKSAEITCAECGSQPGASIYCQNCHAIYPDILVIDSSSAAKRQLSKLRKALKALNFSTVPKPSADSYSASPAQAGKVKGVHLPSQSMQAFAILAIIVILCAGGGYYWYQAKLETKYTENYVRALLGVKMARDLNLDVSARLVTQMQSGGSTVLSAALQKAVASANNDVDILMKNIDRVPKKFTKSNDSLKKLYDSYSQLYTTVTSAAVSADIYSGTIRSIDDDFRKSASELKSGLPEKISAQLGETSKKFKALQDF